jgi:signal transduction histidine kinase
LTNVALYLVEESLFDSTYFYSPLVVFDTLFVTASLVMSGQVETDFYLAYFLIVILCTIWQDFRGLMVVALLATGLYGYFLFGTSHSNDPSIYLRLPFLFVISLFYGYFAQVVRAEKSLKEQAEQEAQDMAMIQTLSQSLPSSLDYKQILETLGDKISHVVKAAKLYIFIVEEGGNSPRGVVFGGEKTEESRGEGVDLQQYPIVQQCLIKRSHVIQHKVAPGNPFAPTAQEENEARDFSFPTAMAVPITFRGEVHGIILLGFNEENRLLSSREIQFCQIVAFAAAIALSNAKKYEELQTEARRRQIMAEELAEANRLKSEYLANTSHELRTPIANIMGYADLIATEICGKMTEEQKKAVGRVLDNARALLGFVDNILDYSRITRGESRLFMKPGDVTDLVDQLREELAPLEKKKPYKIRYEVAEDVPLIETDWAKLKSILNNILNNAIKFTAEGEVKLAVVNGHNGEVSFVVSDTGIGIPKELIPRIFEKFRQVDGSSSRHFEGAGLGLTISKNLVELIGGRIEVESNVGKGSTFKVTVPVASD